MRFVIADDSSISRDMLRSILATAGHEVVGIGRNGLEAVDLSRILRPEGIILDLSMPIMNGLEAAEVILAENLASVIVVASVLSQEAIVQQIHALGCSFVAKPYAKERLLHALAVASRSTNESVWRVRL